MCKAFDQASVFDILFRSENELLFHWFLVVSFPLVISFIWWFVLSVVVVLISVLTVLSVTDLYHKNLKIHKCRINF